MAGELWLSAMLKTSAHHPGPPAFYDDLEGSLAEAWQLIGRGVADRRSPFHTPTVATTRPDGPPALRTVVLRGAVPSDWTLRFHTDVRSAKVAELQADPRIALHFYDPGRKVQIRIDGRAQLRTGGPASAFWAAMKPHSRACYRAESGPGQALDTPLPAPPGGAGPDDWGRENFAVVSVAAARLEWLYLAARGHRRARFERHEGRLSATWLAP